VACCAPLAIAADDNTLTEIVVSSARRAVSVAEVPVTISLIERDDIVEESVLTDALANLSGVYLQQTTPGQGAAIVRGLKGSAILHLVDGMRLNNAMFRTAPTPQFALPGKLHKYRIREHRRPAGRPR
jgi:outer membrane receptor for ferrienterochelin and colicin